ncbi:MAG: response regulator [Lachnospiraceae bacterium]|jgi:CheY-like chemotaxis protein|nr:response regulator [Lachnospiraceae bacterium]
MGNTGSRNVVIIAFSYSVVVRGLEKKLGDKGFSIIAVVRDLDGIMMYSDRADLFLMYLSENTKEDKDESRKIFEILHVISEKKKNMIVIGEKEYHDFLAGEIPDLQNYVWLERPLNMDMLVSKMNAAIEADAEYSARKKILIVDDDPTYAKVVREWIADRYQVVMVTAGMQAITYLVNNPVDLILLDYEMPIVDGPQVLEMLRSESATKDIPVIFLTGVGTRESVTRVMALKPSGYILKTTTREDLRNKLKEFFAS